MDIALTARLGSRADSHDARGFQREGHIHFDPPASEGIAVGNEQRLSDGNDCHVDAAITGHGHFEIVVVEIVVFDDRQQLSDARVT